MSALVVYQSKTGNTIDIAESMAKAIQADLQTAEEVTPASFTDRRLVGLGSGIYTFQHLPHLVRLVQFIPPGCKVFVFSTSGLARYLPARGKRLTHWRLRRALHRKRLTILVEWDCPGQVKDGILGWLGLYRGRPSDEDNQNAARFAFQMFEKSKEIHR